MPGGVAGDAGYTPRPYADLKKNRSPQFATSERISAAENVFGVSTRETDWVG
jgi:hypothetical protein